MSVDFWKKEMAKITDNKDVLNHHKIITPTTKYQDFGSGGTILLNIVGNNGVNNRTSEWLSSSYRKIFQDAIDLVNKNFNAINVNLKAEFIVTNDILTKKEFKNRSDYNITDTYALMMYLDVEEMKLPNWEWKDPKDNLNNRLAEAGWNKTNMVYERNQPVGYSDGISFEVTINYKKVAEAKTKGLFRSFSEALAFTIEHESGHNKFRYHPENRGPSGQLTNTGVVGHTPYAIMRDGGGLIDYYYDDYMRTALQIMHGSKTPTNMGGSGMGGAILNDSGETLYDLVYKDVVAIMDEIKNREK